MTVHKELLNMQKASFQIACRPIRSVLMQLALYAQLSKWRVVLLMLLTAWVGMLLAVRPSETLPWATMGLALLGIACIASSASAMNQLLDRYQDARMKRTRYRPLPSGTLSVTQVLCFIAITGLIGTLVLYDTAGGFATALSVMTFVGYAVIYTLFLKYATPQNIVIGGLAGAMPPLLGWSAITHTMTPEALLLVLIIFVWTPPHFWALSIYRYEEYAKLNVPMLPITHGEAYTKLCIMLYTILLCAVSVLPFIIGMAGWLYLVGGLSLDSRFLYGAWCLKHTQDRRVALKLFRFSIHYLGGLFLLLWLSHALHI